MSAGCGEDPGRIGKGRGIPTPPFREVTISVIAMLKVIRPFTMYSIPGEYNPYTVQDVQNIRENVYKLAWRYEL